jgi:hypothetical protein
MKKSELQQIIREEINNTLSEDFTSQYMAFKDEVDEIWYKMNMKYMTNEDARRAVLKLFPKYVK